MTKEKIEAFLNAQTINEISAPQIAYAIFAAGDAELRKLEQDFLEQKGYTEADRAQGKEVEALSEPDQILKYMRKPMHLLNRFHLIARMEEKQEALYESVCRKTLTTGQDHFVENAVQFFLRCEKDPCEWILMNYEQVRSEYMKSMLCLVLGVRAGINLAPFLILETARMQQTASGNETFSQGPLLGLSILYDRFYRD